LDGLDIDLRREEAAPSAPRSGGSEPPPTLLRKIWDTFLGWGPPMLVVLIIRSILVEPFQIPSGSMVPTLAIGDYILVSKLSYGLRVPFTDLELLPLGEPERGDVIVFLYPPDLARGVRTDYVKRIVGLPGDTVEVRGDVVYLNGVAQPRTETGALSYRDAPREGCIERTMRQYEENLGGVKHPVLQTNEFAGQVADFPPEKVPEGHYFVLGDNRDKSADSRFWKFVPRENIRGKAKWVWLSFDGCAGGAAIGAPRLERIGESIR
jgi:signal peptidase I